MTHFICTGSETVDITHGVAAAHAALPAQPGERDRTQGRMNHLDAAIKAGLATTFHWATADLNGVIYRVNGNHSSNVLQDLDGAIPIGLTAHIDHYKVDSANDLIMLARQFDQRWSARSKLDVAGFYQGNVEALKDVPHKTAKLAIEGIAWHARKVDNAEDVPEGDDIYQWMENDGLHPFMQWLGFTLSTKTKELKRAPIVAAMYAAWGVDEEDARAFWETVVRGGDPDNEKAPTTVLDKWLVSIVDGKGPLGVGAGEIYQCCIYCWNCFRAKKDIDKPKWDARKGFFQAE